MKRVFLLLYLTVLIPFNNTLTLHGKREKRQSSCQSGFRPCNNGECYSSNDMCDGVKDCTDGSDETRETCKELNYPCPNYLFTCDYGACIVKKKVCDQNEDCIDGSDEKNCSNSSKAIQNCKDDPYKFPCNNKECIDSNLICDGAVDCTDKTDESKQVCGTFVCPSFLFQCDYGGCIDKNKVCNGVDDCVDKSDELHCIGGIYNKTIKTPPTTRPITACGDNQHRCKNNECINKNLICDGGKDCSDGSDETKELCKRLSCPGHSFTCEYGGCINISLKCNGVSDCVDGSDESSKLCEPPTSTSPSPPTPTPTPVPLYPTPGGRACQRPSNPPKGIIEATCGNCNPVVNYAAIILKCDKGYIPEKESFATCINSRFTASLTCKPMTCPSVEALSTTSVCYRDGQKLDNCNEENLILKTTVNYKCKYGYQQNEQPSEKQSSECILANDNKAKWTPSIFECVPECGLGPPKGTGFIADGKEAIPIEHPWHCGVYKYNTNRLLEQKCGGTLVSRYFVISAAHCFDEPHKPELYMVIFGKYHRSYGIEDQTQREYQIRKIINHEFFSTDLFENDISFIVLKQEVQYSATLMPACIDFQKKQFDLLLSPGQRGQVAGWGLNANNEISPTLQYTNLEYHNIKECRNHAPEHYKKFNTLRKFCAGSIGGPSVCPGDSGGGLVFQAKEGPPNWYLMGIVSTGVIFTNKSCVRNQYTVFTSIRNELDFIEREFKSNVIFTTLKD